MTSFLEKLKKGMGVEVSIERDTPKEIKEKKLTAAKEKPKKTKEKESKKPKPKKTFLLKTKKPEKPIQVLELEKLKEPVEKKEFTKEKKPAQKKKIILKEEVISKEKEIPAKEKIEIRKRKWFEPEGQLAVDVYQTKEELVIQSAIAGINVQDLDVSIENDVVTIRGVRGQPKKEEKSYFYHECFWGPFSREIILPVEVDPSRAKATMKMGILTLRIPKIEREKRKKVKIRTE